MTSIDASRRPVRCIETVFVPLADGTRLAATVWLPEDAEHDPVPAILEYLPYRRRDGTAERDALHHPYIAGHGYACVRVDMRGSGDSDGVLRDEYLPQEQDDGVEVIAWLACQPWCSGAVGMIGISWGGINGLQIAARRPPTLKAVISLCSTDDRYADDVHAFGGALLNEKVTWGSRMFSYNAAPPDPAVVGSRWREMWRQRLEESGFWIPTWVSHQRRDEYLRQGSVCEDWGAIRCPVYAVSGWADGYTNSVFRLLANLRVPRKGLVGPWAHRYPNLATPGPRIGFLQECLRWWDHWLKGRDTGIMAEPMLRVWLEDSVRPRPRYDHKPGRWVAEPCWPPSDPRTETRRLLIDRLGASGETGPAQDLALCSPLTTGRAAAKFCPYGLVPDLPLDQRLEMGGQLVFDTAPLTEPIEVLGMPVLDLVVAADAPQALLAATLCEVFPDGAATRVSYGILNLTHRDGHESPAPLQPGHRYRVRLKLNDIGHRFGAGHRIRIALSTSYWPLVWPSPTHAGVKIRTAESTLALPARSPRESDAMLRPFPEPEHSAALAVTTLVPAAPRWSTSVDDFTGEQTMYRGFDDGVRRIDALDLEF
ncbi:MAG: CocE/NonD family hydrolase, partial [Alphaproteobacteria bacterium]|nr:CocE/NonD family hydrolase [Alphaproteobacteria bacterium]